MRKILIVDDEHALRRTLGLLLEQEGFAVETAASLEAARSALAKDDGIELVILDLRIGTSDGIELLRELARSGTQADTIIMTAFGSIETAVESMRLGAFDYLTKPINPTELILRVKRVFEKKQLSEEVIHLRRQLSASVGTAEIVARSSKMRAILDVVQRISDKDIPVLIRGETGTGKELIAHAVHASSSRADKLFLPINCCALPEDLLDSELFGHVKGAFTGATSSRRGLFQQAHCGTLFLDEIGEISPRLQSKLLRVLQEKVIRQVGGERQITIDVRIIAATNRDLEEAVRRGEFRSDLFFRLNVLPIEIPPLRERPEDISALVDCFIERIARRTGRKGFTVTPAARARLNTYDWPGNARQLENLIERCLALSSDKTLDVEHLHFDTPPMPDAMVSEPANQHTVATHSGAVADGLTLEEMTLKYIQDVLAASGGNQVAAARTLGISRTTLRRKLGLGP